ncbi:MAG: DUF1566 domain-containing protein, partial [Clostridia bacterium]|nr:DUF1566 domain-containing protein [Clostridia bacterium]
ELEERIAALETKMDNIGNGSSATSTDLDSLSDGVYVYASNGSAKVAVDKDEWSDLESQGYEALGVLLVTDGHRILVAPDESDDYLQWSPSQNGELTGGTVTTSSSTAKTDYNGKSNTDYAVTQLENDGYTVEETKDEYAVPYCRAYSKGSLGAGSWHLPAAGELYSIYENFDAINEALDIIGATELQRVYYWSSTQYDENLCWGVSLGSGGMTWDYRIDRTRVRAVSAL